MKTKDLRAFWTSSEKAAKRQKYSMLLGAGFVLGVVGPYDTSGMPEIALRFAYWLSLLWFAAVIAGPIARWYFVRFTNLDENVLLAHSGYTAIVSLPIFPIVMGFDIFFSPDGAFTFAHIIQFYKDLEFGLLGLFWWYLQVYIITFLVFGAASLAHSAFQTKEETQAAPPKAGQRFINRLPAQIGTSLIALTVEDHYVRAYTETGDTLILMRFSDALAELEGYDGLQVHRSWWVATGAIEKVSREKRRHSLTLKSGLSVPVSSSHTDKLRELGLL